MNKYNIYICVLCFVFYSCERKNNISNSEIDDNIVVEFLSDTVIYNQNYFSNSDFYELSKQSKLSILMLLDKGVDSIEIVSDDDFLINPLELSIPMNLLEVQNQKEINNTSKILFKSSYINVFKDSLNFEESALTIDFFRKIRIKNALILDPDIKIFKDIYVGIDKKEFIRLLFNRRSEVLEKYNYFDIYYVFDDEYPNVFFEFTDDVLSKIIIGKIDG